MSQQNAASNDYGTLILARDFTLEVIDAFEIMNSIVGVQYTPLAVQQQKSDSINYAFFCQAQATHPGAKAYMTKVTINASLPDEDKKTHYSITQIEHLLP
ncbi:hypothetical protein [Vibrio sp. LaRot3]|uniref:hypothetical protein n=1 Tax=Vibrio sp. LaRot3 TaxID=2998829 RepID=UPI0022CE0B25|nr:hypothetical protein [Vibrio sp. LaRot3]MDA0147419.1 hypothetical protein [Vibrio sp. LaRot3]